MENKEEEILTSESYIDEEEEKRLKAENARKELKLILIIYLKLKSYLLLQFFNFYYNCNQLLLTKIRK
ncbi:hypothetical protein [Rickettsia tamurae]|uniref:hypothetical protein n=1 Tax=Rickettsia tamurae TaxID=334545 RepID=UPI00050A33F0|nr:hypothetical protein [Rickettsia tamurae]